MGAVSIEEITGWMHTERAEDVTALDVSALLGGAVGETFVFGTGRSKPHMQRIAKAVKFELKHRGVSVYNRTPTIEGDKADDWLLIDGGSVIVNVMVPEARERLALEQHWEEQGATRLELPSLDELSAAALPPSMGGGGALPGETSVPGEIPRPPTHWGGGGGGGEHEDVYREDGVDDAMLADDASSTPRRETPSDDDDEAGEFEYYYEEDYYDDYAEEAYEKYYDEYDYLYDDEGGDGEYVFSYEDGDEYDVPPEKK